MRYVHARKLHNGDEVIRKSDGASLYVISTEYTTRPTCRNGKIENTDALLILCDDGNTYLHTEVK